MASVTSRPSEDSSDPDGRVDVPESSGGSETEWLPSRWASPVHTSYLRALGSETWKVGFSPPGAMLPETLTDVLARGGHAIRSARRSEAERRERAAAIGVHVEAQISAFLAMCASEELCPPVAVRVVPDVPLAARPDERDKRPQEILGQRPRRAEGTSRRQTRRADSVRSGHRAGSVPWPRVRRERLHAWPMLYWRCESFPSPGRSLHLFVEPSGRMFEGRDDPWPLVSLGRQVRVWQVDVPAIVESMAEVDARRCALHLVHGMAHVLWRAGVVL